MKINELFKIILIVFLLVSCADERSKKKLIDTPQEELVKEDVSYDLEKSYSNEEIAKHTISSLMNQPYEIMEVKELLGIGFHVHYIRQEDKKEFDYKVRIIGNNVIWGNLDGRWRDTEYDEKINYTVENDKLKIIQTFNGGTEIIKEFSKTE